MSTVPYYRSTPIQLTSRGSCHSAVCYWSVRTAAVTGGRGLCPRRVLVGMCTTALVAPGTDTARVHSWAATQQVSVQVDGDGDCWLTPCLRC